LKAEIFLELEFLLALEVIEGMLPSFIDILLLFR
jgi:hypothetical protein